MNVGETTFIPKVPYEESHFSLEGKQLWIIFAIIGIACIVFGTLGLTHQISLERAFSNKASGILLVTMGYCFTMCGIVPAIVFKSAYNDFYPQGNWRDYFKRNWNDFIDETEQKRYDDFKKNLEAKRITQ